jgi:TolB-like protein
MPVVRQCLARVGSLRVVALWVVVVGAHVPALARVEQSAVSSAPATKPAPAPTTPAPAPPPTTTPAPATTMTCSVAVLDLEAQGLAANEAHVPRVLTEALAASVADVSHCAVVTRSDIASMIGFEAERQACGADMSDSCLAEIGSALGVERIVGGAVARVGSSTTVTARLMNLTTGRVEQRAERTVYVDARLREAAQQVGRALFGVTTTTAPSSAALFSTGVAAAGGGGALALGGGLVALVAEGALASADATREFKDGARVVGAPAVVVAGVGVVVASVGGVLIAVAGKE